MGQQDVNLLKQYMLKDNTLYLFYVDTTLFLTEVYKADKENFLLFLNNNNWFATDVEIDKNLIKLDLNYRLKIIFYYSILFYKKYYNEVKIKNIHKFVRKLEESGLFYNSIDWYNPTKTKFTISRNESLYQKFKIKLNILPNKVKQRAILDKQYEYNEDFYKACFEDTGSNTLNLFISNLLLIYKPLYDKEYSFTDILNKYFNKNLKSKIIIDKINHAVNRFLTKNNYEYLEDLIGIDLELFLGNKFNIFDNNLAKGERKQFIHLDKDNILSYVEDKDLLNLVVDEGYNKLKNSFKRNLIGLENELRGLQLDRSRRGRIINFQNYTIEDLKNRVTELNLEIDEKRKEIVTLEVDLEDSEDNLKKLREESDKAINEIKNNLIDKSNELLFAKESIKEKEKKISKLEADLLKIDKEKRNLIDQLKIAKLNLIKEKNKQADKIIKERNELQSKYDYAKLKNDRLLKDFETFKTNDAENIRNTITLERDQIRFENFLLEKNYRELQDDYKNLDEGHNILKKQYEDLVENYHKQIMILKNLELDFDNLDSIALNLEEQLSDEEQTVIEQAKRIREISSAYDECEEKLKECEEIKTVLENTIKEQEKKIENLENRNKKVEEDEKKNYEQQLQIYMDSNKDLRNTLKKAEDRINILWSTLNQAFIYQRNFVKTYLRNDLNVINYLNFINTRRAELSLPENTTKKLVVATKLVVNDEVAKTIFEEIPTADISKKRRRNKKRSEKRKRNRKKRKAREAESKLIKETSRKKKAQGNYISWTKTVFNVATAALLTYSEVSDTNSTLKNITTADITNNTIPVIETLGNVTSLPVVNAFTNNPDVITPLDYSALLTTTNNLPNNNPIDVSDYTSLPKEYKFFNENSSLDLLDVSLTFKGEINDGTYLQYLLKKANNNNLLMDKDIDSTTLVETISKELDEQNVSYVREDVYNDIMNVENNTEIIPFEKDIVKENDSSFSSTLAKAAISVLVDFMAMGIRGKNRKLPRLSAKNYRVL